MVKVECELSQTGKCTRRDEIVPPTILERLKALVRRAPLPEIREDHAFECQACPLPDRLNRVRGDDELRKLPASITGTHRAIFEWKSIGGTGLEVNEGNVINGHERVELYLQTIGDQRSATV